MAGGNPEEIPFENLPEKFVIKVTQGLTFNIICKNRKELNRADAVNKCNKWLKAKFLPCYGEWFYGVEKPRVIVEEFIENDEGIPLFDYKIFCFNGVPKLVYVAKWIGEKYIVSTYDMDFNLLEDVELGYPNNKEMKVEKPEKWEDIVQIAKDLSKDFLHVQMVSQITNAEVKV